MKIFNWQVFFYNLWVMECTSGVLVSRFESIGEMIESDPETLRDALKEEIHQRLIRVLK